MTTYTYENNDEKLLAIEIVVPSVVDLTVLGQREIGENSPKRRKSNDMRCVQCHTLL